MSNYFRTRLNSTENLKKITKKLDQAAEELARKKQGLDEAKRLLNIVNSLTDPINIRGLILAENTRRKNVARDNETILLFATKTRNKFNGKVGDARYKSKLARIAYLENIQESAKDIKIEDSYIVLPNFDLSAAWTDALKHQWQLEDELREKDAKLATLSRECTIVYDFFCSFRGHKRSVVILKKAASSLYEDALMGYNRAQCSYSAFFENVKYLRELSRIYAGLDIIEHEYLKMDLMRFLNEYRDSYPEAQAWLHSLRHNSKILLKDDYRTYDIYFGGDDDIPDGNHHGHLVISVLNDGSMNLSPKAKPYFRPPGHRTKHYSKSK